MYHSELYLINTHIQICKPTVVVKEVLAVVGGSVVVVVVVELVVVGGSVVVVVVVELMVVGGHSFCRSGSLFNHHHPDVHRLHP